MAEDEIRGDKSSWKDVTHRLFRVTPQVSVENGRS